MVPDESKKKSNKSADGHKSIYEMMMAPYEKDKESITIPIHERSTAEQTTAAARPNYYHSHKRALAHNNLDQVHYHAMTQSRRFSYLPFPMPWYPVAGPSEAPVDFGWISESCGGKAAIGIFGGGVMGLLMGVFLGAMSDMTPPVTVINGKEVPQAPLKEQMKTTMRATAEKSMYWCRQFAFITGVFGGSECLVEKYRGTHDIWNGVISGCITGAAMQAKSGPQAAALGCGGFAAFSLVIEQVMGHY